MFLGGESKLHKIIPRVLVGTGVLHDLSDPRRRASCRSGMGYPKRTGRHDAMEKRTYFQILRNLPDPAIGEGEDWIPGTELSLNRGHCGVMQTVWCDLLQFQRGLEALLQGGVPTPEESVLENELLYKEKLDRASNRRVQAL